MKRLPERLVRCPSCGFAFPSNATKPICPKCGTAQLKGSTISGPAERPLVSHAPCQLGELSESQKSWLHRVLDKLNREPGSLNDYVFIELGQLWIPGLLLDHEFAVIAERNNFNSYRLTAKGVGQLNELNEQYGMLPSPTLDKNERNGDSTA